MSRRWGLGLGLFLAAALAAAWGSASAQQAPEVAPVCVYSSPTPTPSAGASVPLQCNANGQLITSGSGGGGATPIPFATNAAGQLLVAPAITPSKDTYPVSSSAVRTTKNAPGLLCGLVNNSATAQAVTLKVYDNASAASGTLLYAGPPLGAGQAVMFTPYCIPASNGITEQATGSTNSDFGVVLVYE